MYENILMLRILEHVLLRLKMFRNYAYRWLLMIIHYNGIKDTLDNVSIDSINKKTKYRIGYYTSHSFY